MNNRKISVFVFLGMFCVTLSAKIPVQDKTRLTDNWLFLRQDVGDIWEAIRPMKPGQPEASPVWTEVTLPHCFNAEDAVDPDMNYYQGPGWYKTQLDVKNPFPNGRVILNFEGAGQKTDVYIHTTKVGSHIGGYDSWNVDITDAIHQFVQSKDAERFKGKIPLSIRCDNSRDVEMIPSDLSDFNVYGGIYRYLNLIYLPEVSVSVIKAEPVLDKNLKNALLKVSGQFYNVSDIRKANVSIRIKNPQGSIIIHKEFKDITPLGELSLPDIEIKEPQIWSVDEPLLYTCEFTVEANGQSITSIEKFGFRHFDFIEKGPFHLNGKRLLLRGTHRHEDHAGVGAAMTEEQMIAEMKMMKAMGVNFIRLGHYQQSEIILNLCDELGILVWEEIPWCRGGLGGEAYRSQARQMLTNMIEQHYNHPAVIIWGLGNENDWPNDFNHFEQSAIRAFMSELNTIAHQLDNSRKTAIRRCAFCSDIVDIYSPSIWAGWYRGNYVDYKDYSLSEMEKVKHFLHVEWGGDSHAGRHAEDVNPTKQDWSETYIVKLIDWHLKEQENMPWLTGAAYWPFKDFSTPVRPDNPVPFVNQKGVVERDLTKKESYYVFQSYWTDTPMVYIYGHNRPVRWGDMDEKKEVLVYSNCPKVELFVNGVSQGIKVRNSQNFPAAGLCWNVSLNTGYNEIRAIAVPKDKHYTKIEDKIAFEYKVDKWDVEKNLVISIQKESSGRTTVNAQLIDEKGFHCLDSKKYIAFEIVGDRMLVQNKGVVKASRKVQACNGSASIQVERGEGKAVVSIKSEGLETQFVTIE